MPTQAHSQSLTANKILLHWVEEAARLARPDRVHWCTGDREEYDELVREMLQDGELIQLDQERWPGCYLHRSDPNDVARTEHQTFICCPSKEDAGPTNNWMEPGEAKRTLNGLFEGCMVGRTMYVIPYLMGPVGGEISKFGVQVTDSAYVAASMGIMTRMGRPALAHLGQGEEIVFGFHSIGDLDPEHRYICHFPQDRLIMSFGSGYGGNALLGKKCFALRLASCMARDQGWLAEHMLILGLEEPSGRVTYMAAAFPSACGKTNLAMMIPPASQKGYKIWTVGDDIAWLRPDAQGRLWAVNPEAGFFGVVPGTNMKTNPNAMATLARETIFTNVAMTPGGEPWWEGKEQQPARAVDWQGNSWTPQSASKAAHPNSRFTAPARQCPCISPQWENPQGVPISAFIFGGRRSKVAPLVYQAFNWQHGVYVAATMASETTAAATGKVGVVRRDPMAMLPFCGYNMADYWGHWLEMGRRHASVPKIFHVNWFRTNDEGRFLWPGYGENLRALRWILERVHGDGKASESPIGILPSPGAIDAAGLDLAEADLRELTSVDAGAWLDEMRSRREFFDKFGGRIPKEILREHEAQERRLEAAQG